jgi:hypothetical protein
MVRDMWSLVTGILVLAAGMPGFASPASLGSAFSDAYTAFAPLYTFYSAYAGYLLYGTEVTVPPGLEEACDHLAVDLAALQMAIIVQTDSERVEEVTSLAHLRENAFSFCGQYREAVQSISARQSADLAFLADLATGGFFAEIQALNAALQDVFAGTLGALEPGFPRWSFSAAFATRTLLLQEAIERIDLGLREILLGGEWPSARVDLPSEILEAVQALASLSGRILSAEEQAQARGAALQIYAFLME